MDRHIEENLESYLQGSLDSAGLAEFERRLAATDDETRLVVGRMRRQSQLIRVALRPPSEAEPIPGFYARVMDRIEAQRSAGSSFWGALLDPFFFRRLVMASATLLALLAFTLFTGGPDDTAIAVDSLTPDVVMAGEPQPLPVTSVSEQDASTRGSRDAVLVDLTTYQE